MNFYSKFLDIHIKERKLTCHDYYGLNGNKKIMFDFD